MSIEEDELTPPYPTLDTTGWVTKPEIKADAVLLNYLQANYSQSTIFQGKVRSFQYTLQKYQGDPTGLSIAVRDDCRDIFGAYFDIVDPRCDVRDAGAAYTGTKKATWDVEIMVDVVQKGTRVSVGRMLAVADSKVLAITPIQ